MPTLTHRYNRVSMAIHWIIAAMILVNIGLAWRFGGLKLAAQLPLIQLHKSIGLTVLILSFVRLAWRVANPPPALPETMSGLQRAIASATHVGLYLVMIGLPLTGWIMSSVSPFRVQYPMSWFGVFAWPLLPLLPHLPSDQLKAVHAISKSGHYLIGLAAYGLIALHVAGALKHQFVDRDGTLNRMTPRLRLGAQ